MLSVSLYLILLGSIAGVDDLYFHIIKFRLPMQRESRAEVRAHILRELSFVLELWTVVHWTPRGAWYFALAAIFVIDATSGILDVFSERESRRHLGGLPAAEYLLHMICASITGGACAAFLLDGGWASPTSMTPANFGPPLTWAADAIAGAALGLALLNAALLFKPGVLAFRAPERTLLTTSKT